MSQGLLDAILALMRTLLLEWVSRRSIASQAIDFGITDDEVLPKLNVILALLEDVESSSKV